ncbi:MAG: cupin domain-containing protein [Luteolibacter sp.]
MNSPVHILHFTLACALSASAQEARPSSPASDTRPSVLHSTVFKWEDLMLNPAATAMGRRWDVTNLPTPAFEIFESHITELLPGRESHPPHQHAREECIVLKEGTLDVSINGTVRRVGAGSLYFFASNDLHNVKNVGDSPATYLVFNFSTAATRGVPATPAAESAAPGKLASGVFDWEKLTARPTDNGQRRDIIDSPTVTCANFECHVTTLNTGESPHIPHRHPDEEMIVVKDGELEITLNGDARRVGAGSIIFISSNDGHGLRNPGPATSTYYDFHFVTEKTPAPASAGK